MGFSHTVGKPSLSTPENTGKIYAEPPAMAPEKRIIRFKDPAASPTTEAVTSLADFEPGSISGDLEKYGDGPGSLSESGTWAVPPGIFPIPAGGITYTVAGNIIFREIGRSRRMFMRGGAVHEVRENGDAPAFLDPVVSPRFCSLIEAFRHRVARREENREGEIVWRSCRMPDNHAKVLLVSDSAKEHLPAIRQLVACPVMTSGGEVLGRGYHDHAGGTFITSGEAPPEVPLEAAREALAGLLRDFAFTAPADKSRAMASLISPALKMGGWIDDDFPLDVAEADQSQSGKTYRLKLINVLFNQIPNAITSPKGGVGSMDESISAALIRGLPFIMMDNFRGQLDSTVLEQAIRGAESVTCRALRTSARVETKPFLWQLSTNGAQFTRDIANRSIITRIRKQPNVYKFHVWAEGDLLKHVAANRPFYLGAVFAVLREWKRQGCPKTHECRHDFKAWCQSLDWIVQNILNLPPLLNGHLEEQARTANPALQWLRDVCMAAKAAKQLGRELSASDFVDIAEDAGLELPGNHASRQEPNARVGTIFKKLYEDTEGEPIRVDGFSVSREEREEVSSINRTLKKHKFYTISHETAE